jgi:hypothetical protein
MSSDLSPDTGFLVLRGRTISVTSDVGCLFAVDCARFTEGLIAEVDLRMKLGIDDAHWKSLEQHAGLLDAVRREREQRLTNGTAAVEVSCGQSLLRVGAIVSGPVKSS